jgi:hypothetical protein
MITRGFTDTFEKFKDRFMGKNFAPVRPLQRRRTTTRKERTSSKNNNTSFNNSQNSHSTITISNNNSNSINYLNTNTMVKDDDDEGGCVKRSRLIERHDKSHPGASDVPNCHTTYHDGNRFQPPPPNFPPPPLAPPPPPSAPSRSLVMQATSSFSYDLEVGTVEDLLHTPSFANAVDDFMMPKENEIPWWERESTPTSSSFSSSSSSSSSSSLSRSTATHFPSSYHGSNTMQDNHLPRDAENTKMASDEDFDNYQNHRQDHNCMNSSYSHPNYSTFGTNNPVYQKLVKSGTHTQPKSSSYSRSISVL